MDWFKHKTNASLDENIVAIRDRWGRAGVCRYWEILEMIARQMNDSDRCWVSYRPGFIQRSLGFRSAIDARSFLDWLATDRRMISVQFGTEWVIKCDKLLKIRARKNTNPTQPRALDIRSKSKSKNKNINTCQKLPSLGFDDIQKVWMEYCSSWNKTEQYRLTPTRKNYIKNTLSCYALPVVLDAVQRFRQDKWEERGRYNDIKYLFGKQERIDKWCDDTKQEDQSNQRLLSLLSDVEDGHHDEGTISFPVEQTH